jgi:hypothetical protein
MSCFFARTGLPLVINTFFNDSGPIVCTPPMPHDAQREPSFAPKRGIADASGFSEHPSW